MAQVDRIIIRFDIQGGKQAQLMLSQMSKLMMAMNPAGAKGAKGVNALAVATGAGSTAMNKMGNSIDTNVIKISEFAVVIFALAGAYKLLIAPLVDVQKNMKIVESVSHATQRELKLLEDEAVRLGTIFPGGAAKATEALVAIGQAGYDTAQSMTLMEPVFKLATIGQVAFADSVELMIATLNAFKKPVSDSAQVVDVLAGSISHTLTTFDTFKVALPALASLSNDLGIEFEEVVALLGFLRDRGLPASRTAMSLKNVFSQLTKQTAGLRESLQGTGLSVEDFDIKAKGLRKVLETVAESSLTTAQKISLLGLRGIYAGGILDTEVTAYLWDMIEALKESGEASFQSGVILEATASKWAQFAGEMQRSLKETFDPMLEEIDKIIEWFKKFIRALRTAPVWVKVLTRWIIGLVVAFTALSMIVKANILLWKNFIWEHGIKAAIPYILSACAAIKTLTHALVGYNLTVARGVAITAAFKAMLGGWIAVVLTAAAAIGVYVYGMNSYEKSLRGQTDSLEENIRIHGTEMETLRGLKKRLEDAAFAYDKATAMADALSKEQKDNTVETNKAKKAHLEFRQVLLDIIREFPELLSMQGGIELFWGSMEDGIHSVSGALDSLVAKMAGMQRLMAELEQLKFLGVLTAALGEGVWGAATKEAGISILEYNKLSADEKEQYKVFNYYKGKIRAYESAEDIGGAGFKQEGELYDWYVKFRQKREPGIDYLKGSPKQLTENLAAHLADIQMEEVEGLINALERIGVSPEKREHILQLIIDKKTAELSAELLAAGLPEGESGGGDGDGKGKGKAAKFVVPELKEFNQAIAQMRATVELEMSDIKLRMIRAGEDQLSIDKAINDLALEKNSIEKNTFGNYINFLIVRRNELSQLEQTEDTLKKIETIDIAIMKLRVDMIGFQADYNDLLIKEKTIQDEINEAYIQRMLDKRADADKTREEITNALKVVGNLIEMEKELADIRKVGATKGETTYDVLQSQLRYIDGQIEDLIRVFDNIETLFGYLEEAQVEYLKRSNREALARMLDIKAGIESTIEDIEAKRGKDEIYESTKESVTSALVDALLSGDVKDAIETFADLLKQAVAEKLAGKIADELGSFIDALSVYRGGSAVGGDGGGRTAGQHQNVAGMAMGASSAAAGVTAGGTAATLGWIGAGLMAVSFLSNLFGSGNKIDEMDTKLNYILRGGGYQLPSSFLLPEDEGEFSTRRRGKDGFNVKFPKRSLDLNITHRFEWEPAELAKAVGSSMSAGSMSSAKQYSLTGGE